MTLQRLLFLLPYAIIGSTGLLLLTLSEKRISSRRLIGGINLLLLVLYGLRIPHFGNHYIKIYSMNVNFFGLWLAVLCRDLVAMAVLILGYWLPCTLYLRVVIRVPSISEILPNRLYIGNRKVPHHPSLLQEYGITHILELTDGGSTMNDPSKVTNATVLQLVPVTDSLGSQESLKPVLQHGTEFIDKAAGPVLVHCTGGVSRAPAMVLYYLVSSSHGGMEQVYAMLRQKRPVVDISIDHMTGVRQVLASSKSD